MMLPLWPPKPKLFDMRGAGCPRAGGAHDEVDLECRRSSTLVLAVGGMRRCSHRQQHGGGLERAGGAERVAGDALGRRDRHRAGPNTSVIAAASAASFSGVDVPWALICRMSPGWRPASSRASCMHAIAPTPPGAGAVMWWASALLAAAEHLAEDRGAAGDGHLPLLEHEHGRALAHARSRRARRRTGGWRRSTDSAVMLPNAGERRRACRRSRCRR